MGVASAAAAQGGGLRQLGFAPLPGFNADVWVLGDYAYLGTWGDPTRCPATGVRILDVADPRAPRAIGAVATIPGATQEDVEVITVATPSYQGDLLVAGIQGCARDGQVPGGLDPLDVTDPAQPRRLAFWPGSPPGAGAGRGYTSSVCSSAMVGCWRPPRSPIPSSSRASAISGSSTLPILGGRNKSRRGAWPAATLRPDAMPRTATSRTVRGPIRPAHWSPSRIGTRARSCSTSPPSRDRAILATPSIRGRRPASRTPPVHRERCHARDHG